jgi:hypothetical protein
VWRLVTINGEIDDIGDFDFDADTWQVTYNQKFAGFGRDLIDFIANVCSRDVVVGAVDTSFVYQDGNVLYPFSTGVARTWVADDDSIQIAYDCTQCNGGHWWVVDSNGTKIEAPNFIILGHELSHAMHLCLNDLAADPEVQARTDENALRSEQSLALRSVNNGAKGCGLPNPGQHGGFSWSNVCFIVSAAVDNSDIARIAKLVQLRDLLARHSALGRGVFDGVFGEYYQFSPGIAADMKRLPGLRLSVSELIVQPLLDFFEVLGAYALGGWDLMKCDREFEDRVGRFRETVGRDRQAEEICLYLSEVPSRLDSCNRRRPARPSPELHTAGWRSVLEYVVGVVGASTAGMFTVWALLSPLEFYWRAVARDGTRFAEFVDDWLARVPFATVEFASERELRQERALLERTVLRSPGARDALTRHLA